MANADIRVISARGRTQFGDNDDPLEDKEETEFTGATLTITPEHDRTPSATSADGSAVSTPAADRNANFRNTKTTIAEPKSDGSWQTLEYKMRASEEEARSFFAVREGAFETAVENCRPVILENIDGELRGAWLLTEIDHWDHEKERLILLTDKSLLIIKYDFITLRILEYRRIYLHEFDTIIHGEIKYPRSSLMPKISGAVGSVKSFVTTRWQQHSPSSAATIEHCAAQSGLERRSRHLKGVRAMWNKGEMLHFAKNWNPWSRDIPYITYTSHRLFNNNSTRETRNYDVELFGRSFIQAIEALPTNNGNVCKIEEGPIVIENYVGFVSGLHNAVDLGFFKSRGRVSF